MDPRQLMMMLMSQQQGNGQAPMLPEPPPIAPMSPGMQSPTGILPPMSPAGQLSIPYFRDQAIARADEQAKSRAQLRSAMMKPAGGPPRSSASNTSN